MGKINDFMSGDHDRLGKLFETFQNVKVKDIAKAEELFLTFKKGLERHIVWEEELLFPAFDAKYNLKDSGPTAAMRVEHKQIKEFLVKIEENISKNDANSDYFEAELLNVLGMHNHKEEMMLYPGIDEALNSDEIEAVLAKIRDRKAF